MSALILALAGGALIGMCARELDGRRSQVARARLTLTLGIVGALGITLALAFNSWVVW